MIVTKSKRNELPNKGEIVGLEIQVGSKNKNEKAPVFSEKYKRISFKYFLVKSSSESEVVLMDLTTKADYQVSIGWNGFTNNLITLFKDKMKEQLTGIKIGNWYNALESEERTQSVIVTFYPSFVITSLSNSTMNEDGTFSFTIQDINGINLDKVARYRKKEMLKYYR